MKKIPTLEVVLTILHAGGKFDNNAYKVSGGLHGVGVSVVNALSKRLVVQVKRDGGIYEMEFARGKTVKKMQKIGTSKATGTTTTFWPDDEIFETTVYDYDTLHDRLQEMAFLNRNLKITLTDERELTPRVEEFCYAGGIVDFVKFLNEGKEVADGLKKPIYLAGKSDDADPEKMGRGRGGHPVEHLLLRDRHELRQQHLHPRGRHAPRGLPHGAHPRHQRLRAQAEHPQGEGLQSHG